MTAAVKRVTVLGSTGSIGVSTLDVVARHPDRFELFALAGNRSVETLFEQCLARQPRYAVMADADSAEALSAKLAAAGSETAVLAGEAGLVEVSAHPEVDTVMAAIVGAAGLEPTLAAARAGKTVLLANKEALVMAGHLFMAAVAEHGARLLPIDSEHNAIFQCLPAADDGTVGMAGVSKILLTASGGPFREWSAAQMAAATPDEACAHPNWSMGRKISVDSATLMNKGLELVEACWLFDVGADAIEVVVHPQSIIHSMVQYVDGSVLAQLGNPDMRTPIAHALGWPERIGSGVAELDIIDIGRLDFERPDVARFPCLSLARQAVQQGGVAMAQLNAANEVAVAAFLDRRLGFTGIPELIENVLERAESAEPTSLDVVKQADLRARELAQELLADAQVG
ncbi:MAG: 1-deoxy-D-xylulose-5-phosphate reductoisomerase [Halieaceae bacterium]|nr:1-deoxy-D-xylulose-5-phosphate reductoisomerase [Halieaceae bacterium]